MTRVHASKSVGGDFAGKPMKRDPDFMTLGQRLAARRVEFLFSQAGLALAVRNLGGKLSQQNVANLERGHVKKSGALPLIARALEVDLGWLQHGDGKAPIAPRRPPGADGLGAGATALDLPIYRTARAARDGGAMVIDYGAPARMERLPQLRGVGDAFAVYMPDPTMSPALELGEIAFVNPLLPARPGDTCLFMTGREDGARCIVRKLVKVTDSKWQAIQYNPRRPTTLPRDMWPLALVIVCRMASR